VAQRLYAPLGTELSLGEYVRLTQRFVDLFAHKRRRTRTETEDVGYVVEKGEEGRSPVEFFDSPGEVTVAQEQFETVDRLAQDLKVPE
jgi:hypothetical protein